METNEALERQIKEVLAKLDDAVKNSRKFYRKEVGSELFQPMDLFEVSIASDTVSLLETEFDILIAKRYKPGRWEEALKSFESKAEALRRNIEHAKKRELPPWN